MPMTRGAEIVMMKIAAALIVSGAFPPAPANAEPVQSRSAACARVKARYAALHRVPISVIAFCDMIAAADSPRGYYVLALHSNRRCESICSTNMGWFAVERATGRVFEWDVAEMRLGAPIRAVR